MRSCFKINNKKGLGMELSEKALSSMPAAEGRQTWSKPSTSCQAMRSYFSMTTRRGLACPVKELDV